MTTSSNDAGGRPPIISRDGAPPHTLRHLQPLNHTHILPTNMLKIILAQTSRLSNSDPETLSYYSEQAIGLRSWVRVPAKVTEFPLLQDRPGRLWDPPTQPSVQGIQQSVREDGHACPPSAEVKSAWSYTSPVHIYLRGVHRDNSATLYPSFLPLRSLAYYKAITPPLLSSRPSEEQRKLCNRAHPPLSSTPHSHSS